MTLKRSLENRIRGWLPKEPTLPTKSTQPQVRQENKPIPKRKLSTRWLITVFVLFFFFLYAFNTQSSTLGYILIGITIAIGVSWIGLRKSSHKTTTKIFKYALIGIVLFVLVFMSLGLYLFNFAGPIVPLVSYSNILDASLTPYLQTLEQSPSFSFLQAEHFGTLTFEDLSIHSIYSNAPGGLEWTFYTGDLKCRLLIGQSGGQPYSYDLINYHSSSLPQNYPSNQQITSSFNQIDSLGLHWFYDQAVGEYQNATGAKPTITDLVLNIGFDNVNNYQGITLVMTGLKAGHDSHGNKIYPSVFSVEFEPNGNILSTRNTSGL